MCVEEPLLDQLSTSSLRTMSIRTSTDKGVYVKVPTSNFGMWKNKCGTIDVAWGMIPDTGCADRSESRIW
jgi:hypothetical protein